jgi:glutamine synthetase
VNGSGKHLNWSFAYEGGNLLEPGHDPHDNLQFLFFCAAVMKAVERHQDLLRAAVAYAGNDHRLGANEAPPAIISIFLGDQLADIFEQIERAGSATTSKKGGLLGLGTEVLPQLPQHAGDRNRTSPFAFTGNKFEFRALGSSQSISFPATVLNTVVAEAIDELATALEAELRKGTSLEESVRALLTREIPQIKRIVFNGDNYSEEWHKEAERRGLLNLRNTLDALPHLTSEKNLKLFEKYGVLSHRELESRAEIAFEQYFKTINIEGETMAEIVRTQIFPAALRYLEELGRIAERNKQLGVDATGVVDTLREVNDLVNQLAGASAKLVAQNAELGGNTAHSKAHHMRDHIIPAMAEVRSVVDRLEKVLPDDLWSLPRYRDMLFVK